MGEGIFSRHKGQDITTTFDPTGPDAVVGKWAPAVFDKVSGPATTIGNQQPEVSVEDVNAQAPLLAAEKIGELPSPVDPAAAPEKANAASV